MENTRREFIGHLATGAAFVALGGSTIFMLDGCAFNIQTVLAWVPTATNAIGNVLTLLAGAGIIACVTCSALANVALAAITAVGNAVTAYLNAPATNKTTLLGKIQTALQAALSASTAFFESLTIPDQNIFNLIVGIASLVLSAISGFIGQLGGGTPVAASVRMAQKSVSYSPKVYTSVSAFKGDLNKLYTSYGHPEFVTK